VIKVHGEEYLTAREAADLLGVKVATLYAYASRGRVRSYRRGRTRLSLYRRAELEAMLELHSDRPRTTLPRAEDWIPYT
jgi:excisionase family DNA binding protein